MEQATDLMEQLIRDWSTSPPSAEPAALQRVQHSDLPEPAPLTALPEPTFREEFDHRREAARAREGAKLLESWGALLEARADVLVQRRRITAFTGL